MKIHYLIPDLFVTSLDDIPLDKLISMKKKAMIFDLDNTITEWNNPEIRDEIISWFKKLHGYDIKACLVSNNNGPRVMEAAEKLGIPYVAKATKPRRRAFFKALEVLQVAGEDAVVVGDQIFTDVLGGNRAGLFTILVSPLSSHEFIGTRFMRKIEGFALRRMKMRNLI